MSEIDLHAITRRLEIIKAESSQGGPANLSTFRNVSDVLADVPGLVDEVRWHRAAMTEIGEWFEQLGVCYVPIAESDRRPPDRRPRRERRLMTDVEQIGPRLQAVLDAGVLGIEA